MLLGKLNIKVNHLKKKMCQYFEHLCNIQQVDFSLCISPLMVKPQREAGLQSINPRPE